VRFRILPTAVSWSIVEFYARSAFHDRLGPPKGRTPQ